MILAFDTYYFDDKAKTVGLLFEHWQSESYVEKYEEIKADIAEYQPGAFYKRELPCILSLLEQIQTQQVEAIIVDGYVFLDDEQQLGLGGYLYNALHPKIPVIGVAKTNFARINKLKSQVYRGQSERPLFVTAVGTSLEKAAQNLKSMFGEHRIPHLLKQLDTFTKA